MVIVLLGPVGAGRTTVGTALAERLGWAFVDADTHPSLDTLHGLVARAIDRRESLVLACPALTSQHRARLIGDLRPVRVVYFKFPAKTPREQPCDQALTVDGAADIDTIMGHIRLEFGV